ncbi:TetR/AcrR family transcriptional regulator [Roseovarius spongiae]|uniref:TetR/AcrR family transcriptional regulator n=1 Tax=Roseovarius spongiae TaxID=2320272 RepID=A0A3A8B608_9RHOB|nr:TetR/AcrR family transcriptional regulator [Roseovarius spongiae]RKF16155.1 TetR/AcrR family transcriptional regulator [Roseovarius spongiae]
MDPDDSKSPRPGGNTKVTRADWLTVAMDILVSDGVAEVKVLPISERLGVSRSSFYWYFKSRKDLLDALLKEWESGNTGALIAHAEMPAPTITASVCNLFHCFLDPSLFNHQLDFAVREWARREGHVRRVIDRSDAARCAAIAAMFERHGFAPYEADARARILYFMQIGYYALDLAEPLDERLSRIDGYILGFTGQAARAEETAKLRAHAEALKER